MSHQSFGKPNGTITDGYILTWSAADGYWKPRPNTVTGGWTTAYDVDFRTATPQTISADGPFTVSGKTWNMVNYASADSVVINSSGLTINCNATNTDFANAVRTAAMATINLSEVITNYDPLRHVVRVWLYNSANNADADYELAFLSLDRTQAGSPINRMLHQYKKGYIGALGGLVHYANGAINNSTQGDIQSTVNYSDDVFIIQQNFPGDRSFQCLSGVYNTGVNDWPTIPSLTYRWNYLMNYGSPGVVLNMDDATIPFKVSIGAQTVNTSNTFEVTFARIKIEYLDIGINGAIAGNNLSGTYPNPTVVKIQNVPVSSAAPSDGYILSYVNADGYWAARRPARATSGLSTDRPAATGSGAIYLCDDINTIYVDNPATSSWKGYHHMGYNGTVLPSLTAVGDIGIVQKADSVLVSTSSNNKIAHGLAPLPGGVTGAGPWQITLSGSCSFTRNSTYPSFGVAVANGTTSGTSTALFNGIYNFNSNTQTPGVWIEVLNTQTRPATYFFDNTYTSDGSPYYFRIINDGTNYIYQGSSMKGVFWRTVFTHTIATVGLTITHYGFSLGCTNTTGFASAVIDGISMTTISQLTITNVTFAGGLYTVTTSTNHGLMRGDSVSITAVTGTGTSPNARYENTVIPTGLTTFTVPGASFTYTSGGLVTLTSR